MVILAMRIFKRQWYLKKIKNNEIEKEKLKDLTLVLLYSPYSMSSAAFHLQVRRKFNCNITSVTLLMLSLRLDR